MTFKTESDKRAEVKRAISNYTRVRDNIVKLTSQIYGVKGFSYDGVSLIVEAV